MDEVDDAEIVGKIIKLRHWLQLFFSDAPPIDGCYSVPDFIQ